MSLLSSLSELTSGNVTDDTIVYADKSASDYKVRLSSIWTYIESKMAADAGSGYVPYASSASTMAASPIIISSAKTGIGRTPTFYPLEINGTYYSATYPFNIAVFDTSRSYNNTDPSPGGGIGYSGKVNAGGSLGTFCGIVGRKENTTTDNYRGYMAIWVNGGSGCAEIIRATSYGNLCIGTTAAGTSATYTICIKNGNAPASSPADCVQLYANDVSSSSELRARDEAGNVTTLSPHNFEMFEPAEDDPFPWSYRSENGYLGKVVNVDMSGAIRALEKLTNQQFIYYRDIDKQDYEQAKAEMLEQELEQVAHDDPAKNSKIADIRSKYAQKTLPTWIKQRLIVVEEEAWTEKTK